MGKAYLAHQRRNASGLEQIEIVGTHRAICPQANDQPLLHHLAHWGNATSELEVTRRVVRYGRASVRQLADVVVREPDTMGTDKARVKSAEVRKMTHQRLAPAVLASDRLDFGFGEMGMQTDAVVTRQTYTATEEGITALAWDGRSYGYTDAPRSCRLPAPDRLFSNL